MKKLSNYAFTLIEILICIAIIFIVFSIIYSSVQKSRQKSQNSVCISNLKQCSQSVSMYASDYDDSYPDFDAWELWSKIHKNSLPSCPLVAVNENMKGGIGSNPESEAFRYYIGVPGYAMNAEIQNFIVKIYKESNKPNERRECKLSDIAYPATTVMLCEQSIDTLIALGPDPYVFSSPYPFGIKKEWERHNGGANYALCDGHVKWFRPESVSGATYPLGKDGIILGNDGKNPSFMKLSAGELPQPK